MVECEYLHPHQLQKQVRRFNRYMVECECVFSAANRMQHGVLIDTWWNVNFLLHSQLELKYLVLIDTWWNVNLWMYVL